MCQKVFVIVTEFLSAAELLAAHALDPHSQTKEILDIRDEKGAAVFAAKAKHALIAKNGVCFDFLYFGSYASASAG